MQSDVAEGTVIEQDPRGGTEAEKGSTVTIQVSLGPGTVAVPKVAGLSVAEARAQLREPASRAIVDRSRPSAKVPRAR